MKKKTLTIIFFFLIGILSQSQNRDSISSNITNTFCNVKVNNNIITVDNCGFVGVGQLYIYDMRGQKVLETSVSYNSALTTIKFDDKIKRGTYVVILSANEESRSLKVVIQ